MPKPLVSICVPTYQGAAFLHSCIESALLQTHRDFELLIVDDGSTDDTVAIVKEYDDDRIRLHINEGNLGLVGNWQRCIDLAQGHWIKFLFQDDVLSYDCVEKMLRVADDAHMVVARTNPIIEKTASREFTEEYLRYVGNHNLSKCFDGRIRIAPDEFAEHVVDFPTINCIGEPSALLLRHDVFQRFGTFHPEMIQLVDWEFCARIAAQVGLAFVDEKLVQVRIHGASQSSVSRATDLLRRDFGDPMLLLADIVQLPAYQRVRDAASRRDPPIDFAERLLASVIHARQIAGRVHGLQQFEQIVRRQPIHIWLDAAIKLINEASDA